MPNATVIDSAINSTCIWCGLIMSTTGTPPLCVRQQTRPGCCGTSLHWHKAAAWEFLLPPELLLNVTGKIFVTSFWSLLQGATKVLPDKAKQGNLASTLLTLLDSYYYEQRAKKVVSDSSGLVDFAIGLVIFVLNGQVLFFEGKFKLQKDCNQSC